MFSIITSPPSPGGGEKYRDKRVCMSVRSYKRTICETSPIFTARRNACIASDVLAIAIPPLRPSVCPSVTRRYCVKTTACRTVQFALSG